MKKFQDFLAEVFVKGGRVKDGSSVLALRENIWVWNNRREFKRLAPFINKQLNTDFNDPQDIERWLSYNHDAVYGSINGGKLYINNLGDLRPSTNSPTLRKVLKQLKLSAATKQTYDFDSGAAVDFDKKREEFNADLSKNKFFHGTSTAHIENLLKTGLRPRPDQTNFDNIEHQDKVFVTTSEDKALFHAQMAAMKTESMPIILELKIPDPDKLVSDYDVVSNIIGANSELSSELGYDEIYYADRYAGHGNPSSGYKDMVKRYAGKLGQISSHMGIFGYKGRIPATFIKEVQYDEYLLEVMMSNQAQMMEEFSIADAQTHGEKARPYDDWVTDTPSGFIQTAKDEYNAYAEDDMQVE